MKQSFNYLSPKSKLNCLGMLGEGSFGSVFKIEEISTLNRFALKRSVKKSNYISREIMMLNLFRNQDFIMHMYTAFYTRDEDGNLIQNILLQYKHQTLLQLIYDYKSKRQSINEELLKKIIQQILKGMLTMHKESIAHRDLKPENILLNEHLEPCIGDLGSAKLLDPKKRHNPYVCTVLYRAPELIWGSDNYTVQVDMWSLGCIIGEMIYQKPIFYCSQPEHIFPAILHRLGGFNQQVKQYYCNQVLKVNPQSVFDINKIFEKETGFFSMMKNQTRVPILLVDLIHKMLKFNPNERITAYEALNHPYFNQDIRCIYYNMQFSRESSNQSQQKQYFQRKIQNNAQNGYQYARQLIQSQEQDQKNMRGQDIQQQRKIQDNHRNQNKLFQQNKGGFDQDQIKQQSSLFHDHRLYSSFLQTQQNNNQGQEQQPYQQKRIKGQSPRLIGQSFYNNSQQKSSKFEQQNRQGFIDYNFQQDHGLTQIHQQQSQSLFQQNFEQLRWNSNKKIGQNSLFYGQGQGQSIQNREHNNLPIEQEQQQLFYQQESQQSQQGGQQLRQIFGDQIQNSSLFAQRQDNQQGQQLQSFAQQQLPSVFVQGQTSNLFAPNQVPNFFQGQQTAGGRNLWNNQNYNMSQAQESTFIGQQNTQLNYGLNMHTNQVTQYFGQQHQQGYQ